MWGFANFVTMNRLALSLLIIFLTFGGSALWAQAPFKGEIIWVIDRDLSDPVAMDRAAERIQLQSDGVRTRWTEELASGSRVVISDLGKHEEYVLIEFLGEKLAIITPEEKAIASPEVTGERRNLDEKQFGRACEELQNGEYRYIYLPELSVRHSILPSLAGIPVLFAMKLPNGVVYYRATALAEKNVASSTFALPEEYRKITTEELQMLFSNVSGEE